MIKENRASKYLLYAIGEIVLVVIGILIALSINNWNEKNKDLSITRCCGAARGNILSLASASPVEPGPLPTLGTSSSGSVVRKQGL